jgi:hypothetical protein
MIISKTKTFLKNLSGGLILSILTGLALFIIPSQVSAVVNPQGGSIGLEGIISSAPPTQPATISTPSQGQALSTNPVAVAGTCQNGLIIEIYDNNIFGGSVTCARGSYTLQIDLYNGINSLVAEEFNSQNQQGPNSNTVQVTFSGGSFTSFTTQFILTTNYARRGTGVNQTLSWPINVSGGVPPYAISANWGDGSTATLLSQSTAGSVTLTHKYSSGGTYQVTIQGTDKNSDTAFLQVVAVISGLAGQTTTSTTTTTRCSSSSLTTLAIFAFIFIILLLPLAFWLGRRHQLYTLLKRLDQSERSAR